MQTMTLTVGTTVSLPSSEDENGHARAFALVSPEQWGQSDWKEKISAVLTLGDLTEAGVTLAQVVDAVDYFTATSATVRTSYMLTGEVAYIIQAAGYRRGPAY